MFRHLKSGMNFILGWLQTVAGELTRCAQHSTVYTVLHPVDDKTCLSHANAYQVPHRLMHTVPYYSAVALSHVHQPPKALKPPDRKELRVRRHILAGHKACAPYAYVSGPHRLMCTTKYALTCRLGLVFPATRDFSIDEADRV
ncbi:hypothetical protein BU25DRAFT_50610 [Macroventuria anomochaeta]|uniref:Uncharacterized protein n=1 Tax=Macroventuria anomochaeta TaxID=301207 RepID=A0ACB6S0M9_9PLEO|nr:uncharacterized protein BU25DRAFT_50610 [Macroventuria anomochaeta]KAF2627589.1 hypothetical protein BU25DRAFT_50610 [Macroventuria anomochaeta]